MKSRFAALRVWAAPLVVTAALLLLWHAVKAAYRLPDWLVPTPGGIAEAAWAERALLARAAWVTARAAAAGFAAAAVVGLALALTLASSRTVRSGLYPILFVLQMMPVIVLAPIIVLWAGYGLGSIVILTFIVSFFPVVVSATQGLISVDRNLVDLFRVWNARRWQEILLLRLPHALPQALAGLRIAATLAPIGAIFGEYVSGSASGEGLGFFVRSFMAQQRVAELFATGLTSCLVGFVFVAAVSGLGRLLLAHWHESYDRGDG